MYEIGSCKENSAPQTIGYRSLEGVSIEDRQIGEIIDGVDSHTGCGGTEDRCLLQ